MARPRPGLFLALALLALALLAALVLGFLGRLGRGARDEAAPLPPAAESPAAGGAARAPLDAPDGDTRRPEPTRPVASAPGAPAHAALPPSAEPARREHLTGTVTDEAGRPLAAQVSLHLRRTETDPRTGAFVLDLAGLAPLDDPLVATSRNHAPAVLEGVGQAFVDAGRSHTPLAIVLRPAGRLAGVVLGHDGKPAAGALVAVREAVPVAEGVAERSASSTGSLPVETDAGGAFVLDGLLHAPYTLIAVDPATLDHVERAAMPDAEGLELRLPAPGERRTVAGVARFPDGAPAEGRTISAFVSLPGSALQPYRIRRSAPTDAGGAFLLEDLPLQDLELFAGFESHPWSLPLPARSTRVELVLERMCALDLRWPAGTPPPDAARALAADGRELGLYRSQWGAIRPERRLVFSEVRGAEGPELACSVLVPESARALLLERGGRPLRSAPVAPRWESETVVRP